MSDPAEPTPVAPLTPTPDLAAAHVGEPPSYSGPTPTPQYAYQAPSHAAVAGAPPGSAPYQAAPGYTAGLDAYRGPGQPVGPGQLGPSGQIRSTGTCVLLTFVTLGIYAAVWYYQVHTEMKRHSGQGLGGGLALLLSLFVGVVMPFITSSEVGDLYERRGWKKPVEATTGLWYFPGILILVGPFIWFSKTNGALNEYWRAAGPRA
jgi:uncharacterized protein DUF4234